MTDPGWQDPSTDIENVNAAYVMQRNMADHYRRALEEIDGPHFSRREMQDIAHIALKYDPFKEPRS